MNLPLLENFKEIQGSKVLLRSDLNIPLLDGVIQDDYRIRTSIPTIEYLKSAGAELTICSHLGRPASKDDIQFSMKPVAKRLKELVGDVEVLENLRFKEGEKQCSQEFISELVFEKDAYVNDAFGACHRAHASIAGPPQYLPSYAGLLLQKEVEILSSLLKNPRRPFLVILGGAKVGDKLGFISALMNQADAIAIGGAMAFTFLVAKDAEIQDELVEEKQLGSVLELMNSDQGQKLHLTQDLTVLSPEGEIRQTGVNVPKYWQIRDIGPGTAAAFAELIEEAGSIFWNGPMGVFEDSRFAAGTRAIADAMAGSSAYTVIGGGDSASALRSFGLEKDIDHLSTGGGATLKFLESGSLVGIDALIKGRL